MATRVIVYSDRIQAAFDDGGSIDGNVRRIGKFNFSAAQHYVPVRTGALNASLYFDVFPAGPFRKGYVVGARADHAIFSLAGTTGPIRAKGGGQLWMRPSPFSRLAFNIRPGTGGRWPFDSVAGQKQNDWLGRSLFVTMKQHGL